MMMMKRAFANREELIGYLREQFPAAAAVDDHISPTRGGRQAAEALLRQVDPLAYAQTRNHLEGSVTRLSPYIRHGVLTLAEVRDYLLAQVSAPEEAFKLIQELAWRDFFQRVYVENGDAIWEDMGPYKTGFTAADYADTLPEDIRAGETGTCLDPFIRQLYQTGYVHNHARMWLAGYVVHWRRVKWQAGAKWFLEHLLDGDPASNNLSWQWVASTFSHKPYFYNLENLQKYGAQTAGFDNQIFVGSYPEIERRLFPHKTAANRPRSKGHHKGQRR